MAKKAAVMVVRTARVDEITAAVGCKAAVVAKISAVMGCGARCVAIGAAAMRLFDACGVFFYGAWRRTVFLLLVIPLAFARLALFLLSFPRRRE